MVGPTSDGLSIDSSSPSTSEPRCVRGHTQKPRSRSYSRGSQQNGQHVYHAFQYKYNAHNHKNKVHKHNAHIFLVNLQLWADFGPVCTAGAVCGFDTYGRAWLIRRFGIWLACSPEPLADLEMLLQRPMLIDHLTLRLPHFLQLP